MDYVSLIMIIDKLNILSARMYNETVNIVDASFDLDKIIDELNEWLPYTEKNFEGVEQ